MRTPTDTDTGGGVAIQLALLHPMRAWVEALEGLLEGRGDIEVVAAHTQLDWVRHAVLNGSANVLVIHLDGNGAGLATLRELFTARPELRIAALSEATDPAHVSAAVRAGVRGWVEPTASIDHFIRVVQGVARGESWFPPPLMATVLDSLLRSTEARQQADDALSALSVREREILKFLAQGLTRQEIAERFCLSPHTVRTHINNVLRKLDVHSTLAAVSIARQVGLSEVLPRQRTP